jgi:hypothetical protein
MYDPKDKTIYQPAGSDLRFDPLELRRKFTLHTQNRLYELVAAFNDGESELVRVEAEETLVVAARKAFGLKGTTETGGTCDATVLEYLAHYLEWLSTPFVPNTRPSPTSSPCTDCPPPSAMWPSVG